MSSTPDIMYSMFSVQDHYPVEKYPDHARTLDQLYDEVIEQAKLADDLGYDTFFVAEHHFHEYGTVPNPAIMMAHIAGQTSRIRLGSAISLLTFHNPLTVAENYAMVDLLSKGRVFMGVGSGYLKHEFDGYGINGAEKRERFDENLEIVTRLLQGERLNYQGKFNQINEVQLNVFPLQQPHPPIAVAILRKEAAYHVGLKGHNMLCVPYGTLDKWSEMTELTSEFQRGRKEGGKPAKPGDTAFVFHTHVTETEDELREAVADSFDLYVRTRLYAKSQTYDDILASGLSLFGTPDTIADKVIELYRLGVTHVMTLHNFGHVPTAKVHRSMKLFAQEVMPRVRSRLAQDDLQDAHGVA
ncbi:LLM class flavin-dependent oxidoreductase [Pusillimonas sp.]|uniref:LLM class flavin-dependent oxidoreductase n=1 Tax=Pusillimonas sp. TaxID=3040095 RepID=UPI0029ACC1E3|nr:LLM class flavin-dependent oxidoreductase [Pusillimonas sp.]MDX3895268.1 LLM class flavin-dependent oxidoreductase [Pusillimonas sp.]